MNSISDGFYTVNTCSDDEFLKKSDLVAVFKWLVLETQTELDKKLGHYEYLLLVKRSFPGSLVSQLLRSSELQALKVNGISLSGPLSALR